MTTNSQKLLPLVSICLNNFLTFLLEKRSTANVHWSPMNKFACKPHGYSVYDECCGKIDLFRVQNRLYMSYSGGNAVRYIK